MLGDEATSKILILEQAEANVIAVVNSIELPEYARATPFVIYENYQCDEVSGKIMDGDRTIRTLTRVELASLKATNTECVIVNADDRAGLVIDTTLGNVHIITVLRGYADSPKEIPDTEIEKYQVPNAFYVVSGENKFDLLQIANNALFYKTSIHRYQATPEVSKVLAEIRL